ncbi:MAG: hypothetical protein R3B51_02060 [Thermodesulfobacteriota bacterium]
MDRLYGGRACRSIPGGSFKQPSGIKVVSTPYGSIPYSLDSLRHSVIDSIRDSVMINGQEMIKSPEGIYYPADYERGERAKRKSTSS